MEVLFVDVGQGTAQIILHGNRRATVIDCGPTKDGTLLQALKKLGVDTIQCLMVSHSHEDHIGGAAAILGAYKGKIDVVCFVQDDKFLASKFWARVSQFLKEGTLKEPQLLRLEATQRPQTIWHDKTSQIKLRTFSPTAAANLQAQAAKTPNATSAVLILEAPAGKIVFASDSNVDQWRTIRASAGRRIDCEILAIPHHGGESHRTQADLDWLMTDAISAKTAIASVGTRNTYRHPKPDVIGAMLQRGTTVMCTQMTAQCHDSLEDVRQATASHNLNPGRSTDKRDVTNHGKSRNVACAGTIRAVIAPLMILIDKASEHTACVDKLSTSPGANLLCRMSVNDLVQLSLNSQKKAMKPKKRSKQS